MILTTEQEKAIQAKIDKCVKEGIKGDKKRLDEMAKNNLYRVRDEFLHLLVWGIPHPRIYFFTKRW